MAKTLSEITTVFASYIAGEFPKSFLLSKISKGSAEQQLRKKYSIEICDMLESPDGARQGNIIAIPSVVRFKPRRFLILVGDLSDTDRVLRVLGFQIRRRNNRSH